MSRRRIAELVGELAGQGIELWFEGERLRFRAPKGALSAEQRGELSSRRSEVVAHLRAAAAGTHDFPLSYGQRSLWFVNQQDPQSAAYNVAFAARIVSPVDVNALRQAFQALVDRHAALRTTYAIVDGVPVQRVHGVATVAFTLHQAAGIDEAALRTLVDADYRRPFDLQAGPVLRAALYTRASDDHVLLLNVHHIATDGWSLLLLVDELRALYAEAAGGPPSALTRPDIQYTDFTAWQADLLAGAEGARLDAYWQRQLAPPRTELELPADRPRPARKSSQGRSLAFTLPATLSTSLRQLARDEGTTLFVVLLAAFKTLLFRYSGTDDVIVGTPTFGRSRPEFASVIGDFVNVIPLRSHLEADLPFRGLLGRLRQTLFDALDAQEWPLPLMVERLHPIRDPSRSPFFETLFLLQRFEQLKELEPVLAPAEADTSIDFAGLRMKYFELDQQEGQFDLSLQVIDRPGPLAAQLKYNPELFDAATISRLCEHLLVLLDAVTRAPGSALVSLPILPADERRLLQEDWNATAADYDRARTVHELFEASARRTPGAPAVTAGAQTLSYRELDERANQLARLLMHRGAKAGTLVAVCLDRTPDMLVSIIAVLKAGAAYVPLDPTHPAERLQYTLADAGATCAITQSGLAALFHGAGTPLVILDRAAEELSAYSAEPLEGASAPDDLAYVIYTSGSTGRPKGVEVEHRNVVAFLEAMRRAPGCTAEDVLLAVTTVAFDIAGLELWLPLSVGGRVVLASRTDVLDAERLMALLEEQRVTLLQATPATWRLLVDAGWAGKADLKALCGGEALPRDLAAALVPRVAELWNMYGPTETTIWSTASRVVDTVGAVPIGRPIANTRVYVQEPSGQLAPMGVPGELCIGGEGVARGYRQRPELTAEKFVMITLPDGRLERVYRTGDVARFRNDGQLEFLGRRDHQVKLRGYRIELGEIEAVLATHPGVKECVVTVREDHPGDQRLVGYVVADAEASFDAEAARETLRAKLPEYMVPSAFMTLPALPLTPNGKIDRKALPMQPASARLSAAVSDALMTPVQRRVADLWQEVLHVERVGLHDNFFDIGGHSLLLTKLHLALNREFNGDLTIVELFQRTTVAAQADRLASTGVADGALRRARARAARQAHG